MISGRLLIDSTIQSAQNLARDVTAGTITVSGYYGCGNSGDEAVLAGMKEAFVRAGAASIRLLPLSQNPGQTRALHGLDARNRMDMRSVRSALAESDLLISGGGSLLQDTTSLRSLLYYLWIVRMALRMRVPVMFYAQGIAPFRRSISRLLVHSTANRASYITVRDEPSEGVLRKMGVNKPPIEVTADPAFALSCASQETVDACWSGVAKPAPGIPKIGVALRRWGSSHEGQIQEYAGLLNALEDRTHASIVLIPMQHPDDVDFSDSVVHKSGRAYPVLGGASSPAALMGLVGEMDVVVAMRLHALIFAARMAVPPFALVYDPKVGNLMDRLELSEASAPCTGFSPPDIAARVQQMLDERASRSGALAKRAGQLESLALRNAEIALSLVIKGPKSKSLFPNP